MVINEAVLAKLNEDERRVLEGEDGDDLFKSLAL